MTAVSIDKKIIILAANGFNENHMTALQRALTEVKLGYQVVAPEQGLVNGWQDTAWGHYFTVDVPIGSALGSDYDLLVLVGGERSVAKLKQNAHARRIVNHFVEAEKPIAAIGSGVNLLALSEGIANRTVAAKDAIRGEMETAKALISSTPLEQDGSILTADGSDIAAWVSATITLADSCKPSLEEAA
jgi:protease I